MLLGYTHTRVTLLYVCVCCRFYGESHPTEDVSLSSLKYLSSRQALADFAYFTTLMWGSYHLSSTNKWVVFGGSYSGALAAWFRQLYPDIAIGAVATSAPVLAKVDFLEYVEVTAASMGKSSCGGCGHCCCCFGHTVASLW